MRHLKRTLVMAAAPEALRGRALGLLSMAIGALPVGMYVLGESAERIGVAPAMILTVEVDVLRDVAEDYARRLKTYGVQTSLVRYPGMFHGAFGLTHIVDAARDMHLDAAAMLRHVLVGDI